MSFVERHRFFRVILLPAILWLYAASAAFAYDACDNKIEKGEQIGGPFFMAPDYLVVMNVLAEQRCNANPNNLSNIMANYSIKHGCGPDTDVYSILVEMAAQLQEHPETSETPLIGADADDVVTELGGCETLLKVHDGLAENYGEVR